MWTTHGPWIMPDDSLDDAYDDPIDDGPDEDELYDQPDAYEDYGAIG